MTRQDQTVYKYEGVRERDFQSDHSIEQKGRETSKYVDSLQGSDEVQPKLYIFNKAW